MSISLPGFQNYVTDSQQTYRAVLNAMAYPGRCFQTDGELNAPTPLDNATASVLLTLADSDTALWLDRRARSAEEWLRFHCGAPVTSLEQADIAVALEWPDFMNLKAGEDEQPELGATLILQVGALHGGTPLTLSGPGLSEPTVFSPQLPATFAADWRKNHARFPRGVDLILCSGKLLAALPRSLTAEVA